METSPREATAAAKDPRTGWVLGERYRLEEWTRNFSYGTMFRAIDLEQNSPVAITLLTSSLLAQSDIRQRLDEQIRIASSLEHKNIAVTVGVYGAVVDQEAVTYLVTEWLDGQTLREMLDPASGQARTFSLKGAYNVVAHLCNALDYAHARTVHGSLGFDSVLVTPAGRVKIIDFAVAAIIAGESTGAAAPERLRGTEPKADSDWYSLGMLTGCLFHGKICRDLAELKTVNSSDAMERIDTVLERALAKRPEDRFQAGRQLKDSLQEAVGPFSGNEGKEASLSSVGPAPTPPGKAPARPAAPPPLPPKTPPVAAVSVATAKKPAIRVNVDATLQMMDDVSERWLLRKDNLDFGPYSIRDLGHQIEHGKLNGEQIIVDKETGERRRIAEHPLLAKSVIEFEARRSERIRLVRTFKDRTSEWARFAVVLSLILLVLMGVGGGILWYVLHLPPKTERIVVRDPTSEYDFLRNVEISMKVDPPPAAAKSSGKKKVSGAAGNHYSDVTELGDVSQGGGDETLDQTAVQRVMSQNFRVLVGCIAEERRRNAGLSHVDMDFIIKGTGTVSAVKVNGEIGTPFAGCMFGKMQTVAFPKFNGVKTHASFSMNLK